MSPEEFRARAHAALGEHWAAILTAGTGYKRGAFYRPIQQKLGIVLVMIEALLASGAPLPSSFQLP